MRSLSATLLLLASIAVIICVGDACDFVDTQSGCKIAGGICVCGYGCKTDFIYKTRRDCFEALRDSVLVDPVTDRNVCNRIPCVQGLCIQTVHYPGFTCKCEGTGFFGQLCERACPTVPMRGRVLPHECIVI